MFRRTACGGILLVAGLALCGCYGKQVFRGPITTAENAEELARLREDQARMEERIERLELENTEQTELLRTMRAEEAASREEMQSRLEALAEQIGESIDRIDRVAGKVDRVTYRMGPAGSSTAGAGKDSTAVEIDPKPLYDAAYLDLIRGNYRAAMAGFEAFLSAYPASALSDDARYWIGECYLAEGEPQEATVHFSRVEKDYPESERVPPALLKMASCYLELGNPGEARKILTRIIDEFPNAVEAPLAKEKLKETG